MTTRLLILGGTAEARALAAALHSRPETEIVSSLAGRVREPRLPVGPVRVGGFGGAAGLARWLAGHRVDALVDATHPYARRIRTAAVLAATDAGVPHLRLERPGWTEEPGDRWHRVPDFAAAAELLPRLGRRVLLTTGRQSLDAFTGLSRLWFLARCVDHPGQPLPGNVEVLLARGPYAAADEAALLRRHRVDVLVTKDSGGALTAGKLAAARELSLPVVMIDRPAPDPLGRPATVVSDVAGALAWVAARSVRPGGWPRPGQSGESSPPRQPGG